MDQRNTLDGVVECSVTVGVLLTIIGWPVVVGAFVFTMMYVLKVNEMLRGSSTALVIGLSIGSLGAACVDDSLYRVDNCSLGVGVTLTVTGWTTVALVLIVLSLSYIPPRYPHADVRKVRMVVLGVWVTLAALVTYGVGHACLSDQLAGQTNQVSVLSHRTQSQPMRVECPGILSVKIKIY